MSNPDILYNLNPVEACHIGITYMNYINKEFNQQMESPIHSMKSPVNFAESFKILYEDRNKDIIFMNLKTNEKIKMDPREIALSDTMIQRFHAADAFYIGMCAARKRNIIKKRSHNHPLLQLVV